MALIRYKLNFTHWSVTLKKPKRRRELRNIFTSYMTRGPNFNKGRVNSRTEIYISPQKNSQNIKTYFIEEYKWLIAVLVILI